MIPLFFALAFVAGGLSVALAIAVCRVIEAVRICQTNSDYPDYCERP